MHFDMSLIALFKFILLVYGAAHCLGCLFYALSVFQGERFDTTYQPFSILYSEFGTIEYNYQTSDRSLSYFICLFKGFNIITALSYESVYPETHVELVFSILCIYLQLVVYAYILGTITNYLACSSRPSLTSAECAADSRLPAHCEGWRGRDLSRPCPSPAGQEGCED